MTKYYEIKAINIDGDDEILYGSFSKSEAQYELQAERDSWKADGYKQIAITSRDTDDQPDPEVYVSDADVELDPAEIQARIDELQAQKVATGGHGRRARLQARIDTLKLELDAITADSDAVDAEMADEDVDKMFAEPEPQEHYFATCALGWKTAPTREEAIEGLVDYFRSDFKRMVPAAHKNGDPGAYVWTCRVKAPQSTSYGIEFYTPRGVEWDASQEHAITHCTTKAIAHCRHQFGK